MRTLENKVPPPFVVVLISAVMWMAAQIAPPLQIDSHLRLAFGGTVVLAGFIFLMLGFTAFGQAKTTIDPVNLERASSLVTGGIYRLTRNPMYVGFTIVLVGWAVYLAIPWAALGSIAFVLFTTRFQIIPEERVMSSKFGQAYVEYKERVRRWL